MPKPVIKILFVEDDPVLAYAVREFLQRHDYEVTHCSDADVAWCLFLTNSYDICLFDIMLARKDDGISLTKNIRTKDTGVPILLLSSKNRDTDRIEGFECGADDYLVKPYNLNELLKRIQVFMKRSRPEVAAEPSVKIGGLDFDYANLILKSENEEFRLTQREADLIRYLRDNANRAVKREEILRDIWGKNDYFMGRSMDVFMAKIRRYLRSQNDVKLQTIYGLGYKLIMQAPLVA